MHSFVMTLGIFAPTYLPASFYYKYRFNKEHGNLHMNANQTNETFLQLNEYTMSRFVWPYNQYAQNIQFRLYENLDLLAR